MQFVALTQPPGPCRPGGCCFSPGRTGDRGCLHSCSLVVTVLGDTHIRVSPFFESAYMSCRQCARYDLMGYGQACPCLHHLSLRGKFYRVVRACSTRARFMYFLESLYSEVFNV